MSLGIVLFLGDFILSISVTLIFSRGSISAIVSVRTHARIYILHCTALRYTTQFKEINKF